MNRAELLQSGAAFAALSSGLSARNSGSARRTPLSPLTAPATGVPVAFLLSDGAVLIDFAGPWEVFQDANVPGRTQPAFVPYTVAESTRPISTSDGMQIVPRYDFTNAPPPKLVVIPAQSAPSGATLQWLKRVARSADTVMSVCTGAFVLAKTGLLDGHHATTHHASLTRLAMQYPAIMVRRGARFVDEGRIATAAGLSSGIDLALHMVARYFGEDAAHQTAYYMEYQSESWRDGNSNAAYSKPPAPRAGFALCPICWMEVDPKTGLSSQYRGKRYYFCLPEHKQMFDSEPQRFLNVS
ncbi:MAG TPA: DJ-1/PfpI family protein [Candidatus Rubrimentiphilum sp.]|nr:DJ-1/PfpI family protein [Candidatus Rubrimentiphilum sp.]